MPAGVWVREMRESLRAYPGFAFAVLITLALAGLIGLMVLLMQVLPGFLGMAHFREPSHRTHDLTYGLLFTTAVVGLIAQLRRPSKNVAGMFMALLPWVALLLAVVLSTDPGVIRSAERILVAAGTVTAALLHPARRDFFRSFSVSRVNWVMLALVILAAVPLIGFASTNVGLQGTVTDEHAAMGHYGFMAAFSFTVIGVGLLASLRPEGWRITAWVAGLLPAILGLTSVVYPEVSSSLSLIWSLAAIAWGVAFVAAAELSRRGRAPKPLGSRGRIWKDDTRVESEPESPISEHAESVATLVREDAHMDDAPRYPDSKPHTTPRWVKVFGVIALLLVLLVVVLLLFGPDSFGPGVHGPSRH